MSRPLEDAAKAWVSAAKTLRESSGPQYLDALTVADMAFHDLVLAAGFECWMCDEGSCPGLVRAEEYDK